jgi:hypothetical protein
MTSRGIKGSSQARIQEGLRGGLQCETAPAQRRHKGGEATEGAKVRACASRGWDSVVGVL